MEKKLSKHLILINCSIQFDKKKKKNFFCHHNIPQVYSSSSTKLKTSTLWKPVGMLLLLGWTPFNTLLIPRQSRRTGGLRVIALCRLLLLSAPRKLVEEGARAPGPHSPVQELDFLPRVVEIHSGFHEKNWIKTII